MVKYFSYGSNMSLKRMEDRKINPVSLGVFRLDEHDLRFHKVSIDGSAKCDAFFTECSDDFVLGVLYEIDDKDEHNLDNFEGLGNGYGEKIVVVYDENISHNAKIYVATKCNKSLLPYTWYLKHVIEGAQSAEFPASYIEKLEKINTINDPNSKRKKKQFSIHK